MGFVLEPDAAQALLDKDQRSRDVLFPYLNGEDLNSHWDQSPSRWVIDFHDWPLERASEYTDCFKIVERLVKPERLTKAADVAAAPWWQFWRTRPEMYTAITGLDRVLVRSQVSKTQAGAFVSNQLVYDQRLVVFATAMRAHFALLDSSIHYFWAMTNGSTLRTDATYTPTQCFETFPFPAEINLLETIGEHYHSLRREIMIDRREGLTATYNRFHAHDESADIAQLRKLHIEMDYAVSASYGWTDLDLGHDRHETKQGLRFTISEAARREVLDRLLALNHERYAQEQASSEGNSKNGPKKKPARKRVTSQSQLF
jgi:hypothetical protein